MNLEFLKDGLSLNAIISGELDHHVIGALRENIDFKLSMGIYRTLCLDLRNVTFMDSSVIALIMGRAKNMEKHNGKVVVKVGDRTAEKILNLSGIKDYVTVIYEERNNNNGNIE